MSQVKSIHTEIIINATKEIVWDILTNFQTYREWNSFIISSIGQPIKGSILENKIDINGQVQKFKPKIVVLNHLSKLEWIGSLPFNMFSGQHSFEIIQLSEHQVKLIQSEHFSGWLSGFIFRKISDDTTKGFIRMNQELRDRAERSSTSANHQP